MRRPRHLRWHHGDGMGETARRGGLAPRQEAAVGVVVEALARWLALAGGAVLIALTAMTIVSIVGRYIFSLGPGFPFDHFGPVKGDFELVGIGCAFAVCAFLPYCHYRRGHVTVDIFFVRASPRLVAFTSLIGNILITLAAALIAWRLAAGMIDKARYGETTFILLMPTSWGYAAALVGAVLFAIVAAYTIWRSLNEWLTDGEAIPGGVGK